MEGRVTRGGHEVRELRQLLLPVLHALQSRVGWISEGGLNYACERLSVPPAEAYGVATLLRDVQRDPPPADRRPRLRRPRVSRRRCEGAVSTRSSVTWAPKAWVRDDAHWHRSPCLGHVRAGACDARPKEWHGSGGRRARRSRVRPAGAVVAARGEPVEKDVFSTIGLRRPAPRRSAAVPSCASSAGSASSTRPRSTTTARTAATKRSGLRSRWVPRPSFARSPTRSCSAAGAPRSPPGSNGRRSPSRSCGRTTSWPTPTNPSRERSRTAC